MNEKNKMQSLKNFFARIKKSERDEKNERRRAVRCAVFFLLAGALVGWCGWQSGNIPARQTASDAPREIPIYFVETELPRLAISFDAAWGCERTERILAVLRENDVKATFFLTNIWLEDYPEMAKKIAAEGHEIAMHSVSHPHMSQLSEQQIIEELAGNAQLITEVTGYHPTLFRFPFGEYDDQSMRVVRGQGYYPIQWSIDSLDWMEDKTADDIIDRVTLGLHPGAIILCHNNGTHTAEAIAAILPYAKEQGYEFVPVGELIYKGDYQTDHQGMQKKPAPLSP